jgi:hypothetical protein
LRGGGLEAVARKESMSLRWAREAIEVPIHGGPLVGGSEVREHEGNVAGNWSFAIG